ncbi:MAG: type II toxin-antitoxin system VapC family toxin [Acidobacteriota bacterium]
MRYFDASALAKRYVRESGSLKIQRLLAADRAATSRLTFVEIVSAVRRRVRDGSLSGEQAERATAALDVDLDAMLIVELTAAVVRRAQRLLQRHPLRAGDAVQLASALHLRDALDADTPFVAFDAHLIDAARAEGLRVE